MDMKEFTPIFTERATNILAPEFREAVQEISASLKEIYNAHSVIVLPGSGTFGMEAAARQFAVDKKVLVISNGFFGERWNKILVQGNIANQIEVLKAEKKNRKYYPPNITEVLKKIEEYQPQVIFITHVETSTGIMLPEEYIQKITQKARQYNGLVIIDAIASGNVWLNMKELDIDILLTAPQKGLSAHAGCAILLLNETARNRLPETKSASLSLDLREWMKVMEWFEGRDFAYHTTLPTDVLLFLRDSLREIVKYGINEAKESQQEMGRTIRGVLEERGFASVAAEGFEAPSVVVHFADDPAGMVKHFSEQQLRIAGALPFMLENAEKPKTFRIGLLGLEKIKQKEKTTLLIKETIERLTHYSK